MKYKVHNPTRDKYYKAIGLLGFVAIVWEIFIFRKTVIDTYIPITIILCVGFIVTILDKERYGATYGLSRWNVLFFSWAQSTISWGFISCFMFMSANYYLSDSQIKTDTLEIVSKSSMTGRKHHRDERKPLITILYKGQPKELVFSHKYYADLDRYKSVTIEFREGFLGFDIFVSQKLNT